MSLRVWLPLDGDLRNQGISDLNTINMPSSATVDNTGKIGKCYTSSGAASGVSTNLSFSASQFSIAAWVRINTRVNAWRCPFKLINSTAGDYIGFCCEHNTQATYIGFHFYKTIDGTNTSIFDAYPITDMTVGQWTHLAVTYDGKVATYYKDGIKVSSTTIAAARQNTIANIDRIIMLGSDGGRGGAAVKSSLNDVRIYDNCLSAAEVKEIAQGLVLHYKLDNNGQGGRNLMRKGTGTFHNTDKLTTITWSGWDSYNSLSLTDIDWNSHYGDYITYSCYMENVEQTAGTGSGIMLHFRYADGTYQQFGGGKNGTSGQYLAQGESGWLRLTVAIPNASTRSNPTTITYVQASVRHNSSGGASTIRYQYPQVEYGNKQTVWSWAPEDIGDDPARIEDSSGYNHNGTIVGSAIPAADTARYNVSTHIDGAGVITAVTPGADIRTLSCWVKTTKNKSTSQMLVADSASNMCISFYAGTIIGVFGATRSTGSKCTLGASYKENDWNHIVVVKTSDDGQRDIYCNGEKLTPAANDYWSATAGFFVGNRNGTVSGNTPFYGYISDVRAYCTPLLDTDIKQLYNVGMKIDKSYNIHTYELHQEDENKLHRTGVLSNSNFNEINNLFNLLYDKQLYIEPDGSCWIRIFHHANCDTKLFVSSDTFTTSVYKDADRWFNVSLCNKVNKWELMVKSMPTAGGTETKYRWIQTKNPMTAAYADVAAASVTKVTGNGYASYGWGGLYHIGSSTYLSTNNGTNGNWWGAVGAWANHQDGIPGWTTVITTGYEDVYLRIDNLDQVNLHAKNIKAGMWTANQFIEK